MIEGLNGELKLIFKKKKKKLKNVQEGEVRLTEVELSKLPVISPKDVLR